MPKTLRIAVVLGLAGLAACSPPPGREARLLQAPRAVVFGPPARPGIDGPAGITEIDTPAPVWTAGVADQRTTAALMAEAATRPPTFTDWRERPHPHKHRPSRRALPQDPASSALAQRAPSTVLRGGGPLVAQTATTPNVDVATLADTAALPPDTMGDVGPTQYFAALNGRFRTVSKDTGLPDGALDLDSDAFFAGSLPPGHFTSDPRVRFDRRVNRWVVLMISVGIPNRFVLAVSDGPVISGGTVWARHHWDNTRTQAGGGSVPCLADYPTLGIDEDALYVGVNQFCGADVNSLAFDSTSVYVVNKQALVGGTLGVAQFNGVLPNAASAGIYTPQGVDNVDANTSAGYVIGVNNTSFGQLVLRRVSDPGGTPSLSADITLTVPTTAFPIDVPHLGGTLALDGLDDRLLQAVIRNGHLWTTHQMEVNSSGVATAGGGRDGIRWYELQNLAGTPSVAQSGTVFDTASSNPLSYWMGAIMPNGQGHVALGMSVAGAAARVNAAFTGRLAADGAGAMDAPVTYTSSAAAYNQQSAPDPAQRWGDYSYTSVDPDDDQTFWTLQQYVNGTNSYAVRLVRLLAPAPAAPASVAPSAITAGQAAVTVTVTGDTTGGRGFFDPGPGFAHRLAASFGAGVTVTGVTVNGPGALTLTLNTVGAAAGARALTVTNPDGQTSTLASAITIGAATPGPPVFSNVPGNQQIFDAGAGGATPLLPFQVVDPDGSPFTLTATSSNTAVVPNGRVQLGGPDALGNATVRVLSSGQFGSATITLRAQEDANPANATTASFVVTVSPSAVASAPQAFAATVVRNRVTFTWQPPLSAGVEPVSSYRIEAGFAPGQTAAVLPAGNVNSYTVFAAPDGVFFVRVRAQTAAGLSTASNEIQVATGQAAPPLAPQALLATVQGTAIALQWTENPTGPVIGAYYLLAGSAPGLADIGALPLPATARTFTAVAPPGTYYVRIAAVNAAGAGAPSNEAVLVAQPGTCTIPALPSGAVVSQVSRRVTFGWNAPTSGAIPTAYRIQVGTAAGLSNIGVFPVPGSVFAVSGLVSPGPYFLRVAATNACGSSSASSDVSVTVP